MANKFNEKNKIKRYIIKKTKKKNEIPYLRAVTNRTSKEIWIWRMSDNFPNKRKRTTIRI